MPIYLILTGILVSLPFEILGWFGVPIEELFEKFMGLISM